MVKSMLLWSLLLANVLTVLAGGSGKWSAVRNWPVIPVGIFHLDDGRLLGYAALQDHNFAKNGVPSSEHNYTQAAIWNPATDSFTDKDLDGHDIFCPGMTFLPNGDVFAGGGGNDGNSHKVSVFKMSTKTWVRHGDMDGGHWYGTAVATNSHVVMIEGVDKLRPGQRPDDLWIPEVSNGFDFDRAWSRLPGADLKNKVMRNPWYPQSHLLRDGHILLSGTSNGMYVMDSSGSGSTRFVGNRNTDRDEQEAWGATTIMYRPFRMLSLGGIEGWTPGEDKPRTSLSRVIEIDARNPNNVKTKSVAPMNFARGFQNAVLGPDGNVYVFGGHQNGFQFNDTDSILTPEVYNPYTNTWRTLAPMKTPRNYHSVAILMADARIFVGGGGLCGGCSVNHMDHEIFSPPYLFEGDGQTLRLRPHIDSIPASARGGDTVSITLSGPKADKIKFFMWMHFYSVTHSISTDLRGFKLRDPNGGESIGNGKYVYKVVLPRNRSKFTRGPYWVYAVTNARAPSVAKKVQVG
eukprot:CAMPEP_0198326656 /NCGR_PEP_ID=MMETSP1450-20131203/14122_1 /TAXON_ID=753684 ORGANISM="Madagascaria erythrocladiodes, Strain CCMP3234" /NCGR_SAMPLE_ID=MMETSP1450 /ASSEMBLY_ACC=CAM_ASM_001115 /LENGTH=517 /DNA_ID=CAMNT_0044030633 /DNA_START=184 /DNA_END=1737 /DNA_ORIENTATION=-